MNIITPPHRLRGIEAHIKVEKISRRDVLRGLGIAGGNLERDLATIQRLAEIRGTEAGVVGAWQRNSRYRRDWPLRQLQERVRGVDPVVGILGVTYKENTHSIKNSPAVALIKALTGCRLAAFDPVVRAQLVETVEPSDGDARLVEPDQRQGLARLDHRDTCDPGIGDGGLGSVELAALEHLLGEVSGV